MSIALDKLKERMHSELITLPEDIGFQEYSRVYLHSNENLKLYVKDLKDKKVLCVAGSGDHLFNSVMKGAISVDTFDINRYAELYQRLRIEAILRLNPEDALYFLTTLNKRIYKKFNDSLPDDVKEVFDYLLLNYSEEEIWDKFFQDAKSPLHNNNYESVENIEILKERLLALKHIHYICNIYDLPKYLQDTYDAIYLSNVLGYQTDYDAYFNFVRLMREQYLNEDGELYFDYLWGRTKLATFDSYFTGRNLVDLDDDIKERHKDIIGNTEPIKIKSVYDQTTHGMCPYKDVVLRIKK